MSGSPDSYFGKLSVANVSGRPINYVPVQSLASMKFSVNRGLAMAAIPHR